MLRRLSSVSLLAFATVLLLTITAESASASYCYNYSFNWATIPYFAPHQDMTQICRDAINYQDLMGYDGRAYTTCRAQYFCSNLGSSTLASMYVVCHADPGTIMLLSTTPVNGYFPTTVNSNFTLPDIAYGIEGSSEESLLGEQKLISQTTIPNARLVTYQGCETGRNPTVAGRNNLLWQTVHQGADTAVGFGGDIGIWYTEASGHNVYLGPVWSDSYWNHLCGNWSVGNSIVHAAADVWALNSSYYGYNTGTYQGNGSLVF